MNKIQSVLFGMASAAFLAGCKENNKEVAELRKELAELKAQAGQVGATANLQEETNRLREGELVGSVFIVTEGGENVKMGLVTVSLHDASLARDSLRSFRVELKKKSDDIMEQLKPLAAKIESSRKEYKTAAASYEMAAKSIPSGLLEGFESFESNPQRKAEFDAAIATRNERMKVAESKLSVLDKAIELFNEKADMQRTLVRNYEQLCVDALPSSLSSVKTDADGKFSILVPKTGDFVLVASASRRMAGRVSEKYVWVVAHSLEGKDRGQIFLSNDNQATVYDATSIVEKFGVDAAPVPSSEFFRKVW